MNMLKITSILGLLLMVAPGLVVAETHKKVQAALDYEIPENKCKKPKKFATTKSVTNAPAASSGSVDVFSGGGGAESSDTDSYTINRLKKKEKNWRKCVAKYKENLLQDMDQLKNSAQYGLTQEQANTIAGNMLAIHQDSPAGQAQD